MTKVHFAPIGVDMPASLHDWHVNSLRAFFTPPPETTCDLLTSVQVVMPTPILVKAEPEPDVGQEGHRRGPRRVNPVAFTVVREAVLLEPGEYDAVFLNARKEHLFNTHKLAVAFRVYPRGLECPDEVVVLARHYRVTVRPDGRVSGSPHSDFVRELQCVTGQRARRLDRLAPSAFAGCVLRVLVKTVTVDRDQRKLHPANQYSVIERVLGRRDGVAF